MAKAFRQEHWQEWPLEGIREWVRAGSWARSLISGGRYMRSIEIPQVTWVACLS